MNIKFIIAIIYLIVSICYADGKLHSDSIELGISSISMNKEDVIINIYGINQIPIAGIQLDISNDDLFTIDSVSGGRCLNNNFTMYSNDKGRILAFSMKGNLIPNSLSYNKDDNILFRVYGKINSNKMIIDEVINIESIIAGKKGEKLNSVSPSFIWKNEK